MKGKTWSGKNWVAGESLLSVAYVAIAKFTLSIPIEYVYRISIYFLADQWPFSYANWPIDRRMFRFFLFRIQKRFYIFGIVIDKDRGRRRERNRIKTFTDVWIEGNSSFDIKVHSVSIELTIEYKKLINFSALSRW